MPEGQADELREALLQLGHDRVGDLRRRPRPLLRLAAAPLLDVGFGLVRTELHRRRVEQHLEALGELAGDGLPLGADLDARVDPPPWLDRAGGQERARWP